ncbi:MAG: hypothetical protein ICV74_03995 [Thermoleophilia bacterium]|nr:hypothetical protein [Thermoleophilia bacterium]
MNELVVVVPLKPARHDDARRLLAEGPPFELGESDLVEHEVHLTKEEVVFVFRSTGPTPPLALAGEDPAVWKTAAAWQPLMSGRPRVAETVFSWSRDEPARKP